LDNALWTLDGSIGRLRTDRISALVDVARPDLGFREVRVGECATVHDLLCVRRAILDDTRTTSKSTHAGNDWPLPVADAYARGVDLVASYQATEDWPYSPQIYWSADATCSSDGVLSSFLLLVSMQTSLLDAYPQITVGSRVPAIELLHADWGGSSFRPQRIEGGITIKPAGGICCLLQRMPDSLASYAEFVSASDIQSLHIETRDGNSRGNWRLFAEFLEKGVIRRARIHAAFLRRDDDVELAAACCRAIEHESLPLTV
jgi:hypothetical protein